jgi:hypothetical protein
VCVYFLKFYINSNPCESAGVQILRVMTISGQGAQNAVRCRFPQTSVRPSDALMFENLCSGKLIVFGGFSGGLIDNYLAERGA